MGCVQGTSVFPSPGEAHVQRLQSDRFQTYCVFSFILCLVSLCLVIRSLLYELRDEWNPMCVAVVGGEYGPWVDAYIAEGWVCA